MGFFSKELKEKRQGGVKNTATVIEDFFDTSERAATKLLGAGLDITGGLRITECDEDQMRLVNMGIDYWKALNELAKSYAELEDSRYENLENRITTIEKQLETQRCMLRDISGDIVSMKTMLTLMNDQIKDKSIVVKKGDKKAE